MKKCLLHYRRQIERSKLAREKQLRETAEREKAVLEHRLLEYQEEIRLAKEALVYFEKESPRLQFICFI